MPYRLKRGESVPNGIRRIVTAEIDSAAERLQRCAEQDRDDAIHEARKGLKKIRGALRIVQPEMGAAFREENERFRDLGRHLAEIRDAQAIGEVFETIVRRFARNGRKSDFDTIRHGIQSAKREKEQSINVDRLILSTLDFLQSARERVAGWPLYKDGFQALATGMKLTYRRGRRALTEARRNPNSLTYHALRKRVKDHWYHIRLLESLWTEAQQARESSLHDLETWLGDDHNLVLLCEQMQKDPDRYGGSLNLPWFLSLATRHQQELRSNSLALGQRLYEERPRDFVRRMEKLWDVWQQDPKSMKQLQKDQRNPPRKQPAKAASKISVAHKALGA
jgi:CHAD domain-containing protein